MEPTASVNFQFNQHPTEETSLLNSQKGPTNYQYGGQHDSPHPVYQQNPQQMYGQNPPPIYGQNPQQMYGQYPQPGYGYNPQPAYGQSPQAADGQNPQFIPNYPIMRDPQEGYKQADYPPSNALEIQNHGYESSVKPKESRDCGICSPDRWLFSLFLSIFTPVLFALGIFVAFPFLVGAVFFEIAYLIESCTSDTFKFLRHKESAKLIYDHLNRIKAERPIIVWKSRSYHTTHSHISTGSSRRSRERKVYTHSAEYTFQYSEWNDASQTTSEIENYKLCRFYLHRELNFTDDNSRRAYEDEKQEFRRNNDKDRFQEFTEDIQLPGYYERILAYRGDGSLCLNSCTYFLLTLFFLGWAMRLWLHCVSARVDFTIVKKIKK